MALRVAVAEDWSSATAEAAIALDSALGPITGSTCIGEGFDSGCSGKVEGPGCPPG